MAHCPRRVSVIPFLASLAILVFAAGCGDDDDTGADQTPTSSSSGETGASTAAGSSETATTFCETGPALDDAVNSEDPSAIETALANVAPTVPPELTDAFATAAGAVQASLDGDETAFDDPALDDALAEINRYYVDSCGFAEITVTGTEYEFDGAPSELATGRVVVSLTNDGAELHQALVARINDPDMTIEEILQLPEAEQEAAVTIVGGTFAAPGETGSGTAVLDTPGSYALICLIPQGMTSVEQSGAALDGPPHVSLGMWAAFTVT